ncbi:hypothetical protein RCL_jg28850.t1 [Rhizophagus clarus]|uniref:Tc1-like transposase DDE domain-containing protein n=1 Tax=Rhizophagus clarus TaxID=94130 RepID=A0A8H3LV80_9GLOM|nr:hypothetical protein RCL_jg28850.t1 [Rhizophagus clarus]
MPRVRKKVLHLRKIAKTSVKVKRQTSFENIDDNDYNSSDNENLDIEFEWEDEGLDKEKNLFQILVNNMRNLKPSKRPLTYHGNSTRTKKRRKKAAREAIKNNGQTLDKFFRKERSNDEDIEERGNEEESDIKRDDKSNNQILDEYITEIENKLKNNKQITPGQKVRFKAIQYFFQLQKSGHHKMESAKIVAQLLNRGERFSKCVRAWAKSYTLYNDIPQIGRGKYSGKSLLEDEGVRLKVSSYLRKMKHNVTIHNFCDYISSEILPSLGIETKTTISTRTVNRWLKKMGFVYDRYQKGMYVDGHERPDVVEYRKQFLEEIDIYQKLMLSFEGNDLERQIDLILNNNEKLHILVTHDKTTFQSNDGLKSGWMPDGEQPLRKKGQGRSIHISDFLTDTIGRLKLNDNQINEVGDSMYHETHKLIEQIENRAIPIFEKTHPGAIAVFAFDNSSSHGKYADDALNANHMNLNPGGKQDKLRDTIFNGQTQYMNFPDNYHDKNLCGKPKGMRVILEERGLWPSTGLKAYCGNNEYNINSQCCARHILSNQPDFLNTKPLIQEVIEARGHKVIFYPKFHCELNYIEMYWGAAKRYARQHCNYSWTGLQRVVLLALDSVPISHIRKYARKSARYMDCYRKGLNAKQAEYAVKKFKSHRAIPNSILTNIDDLCN